MKTLTLQDLNKLSQTYGLKEIVVSYEDYCALTREASEEYKLTLHPLLPKFIYNGLVVKPATTPLTNLNGEAKKGKN